MRPKLIAEKNLPGVITPPANQKTELNNENSTSTTPVSQCTFRPHRDAGPASTSASVAAGSP